MTSALAMYYIHFEFIAKPQVDCIDSIAMSKIRLVWRDSMPFFQESAEGWKGDAPSEPIGDARDEERSAAGRITGRYRGSRFHILRGFRVGFHISAFRY